MQRFFFVIDSKELISFAKRQPDISIRSAIESARSFQRRVRTDLGTILRCLGLACTAPGRNYSCQDVDRPDSMVLNIADKETFPVRRHRKNRLRPCPRLSKQYSFVHRACERCATFSRPNTNLRKDEIEFRTAR